MGATKRVIWSPAAEQDLLDIWAYYARVGSPTVADNLLRDIQRAGEAVAEHPLLSRDRRELLRDLRSVVVHPHVIFFRVRDDDMEIARVLHGRRDFPAIFSQEEQD